MFSSYRLNKRVRACSQGMRQQLTLAIAYMTGARYLLLDEPMNALDPTNVQLNSAIMRSLAQRGRGLSCRPTSLITWTSSAIRFFL